MSMKPESPGREAQGFRIVAYGDDEPSRFEPTRPETKRHTRTYIHRDYTTLREAYAERMGLLRHYPEGHFWRHNLLLRAPDGTLWNPDEGPLPASWEGYRTLVIRLQALDVLDAPVSMEEDTQED